jgi:hypothetical protein
MPYEANEEPEITYTGSINNAEIICIVRPLPEMIKARAYRISAYAARAYAAAGLCAVAARMATEEGVPVTQSK